MESAETIKWFCGEKEAKDRSGCVFSRAAANTEGAMLTRCNLPGDPQAETITVASFGGEEGIEDVADFVGGNARSSIGDGEDKTGLLSFPVARNMCAHQKASS